MLIGLLRFIFWFFVISYLLKIATRFLAPILMKRFANKIQDRFQHQFNQQYKKQQKSSQDGEVIIDKTNTISKNKSKDVGEYVDFEEVDD